MNLERLMKSNWSTLADRGAQEARKFLERAHLAPWGPEHEGAQLPEEIAAAARGVLAAPGGARGRRFFRGALGEGGKSAPSLILALSPDSARRTIAAADKCRAGRFDLLGYRDLCFGEPGGPLDWHLDAVRKTRAPRLHWSRIRALDTAMVGDSKVTWELNRCQWFVTLARAHALTGERAYADAVAEQARAWREENPPGIGINWSSSLEVSLRLIAWCWTAVLLREALATPDLQALLLGIREHARHVSRYLSRHFSPNTHLTGEALGLFYAGTLLPELEEAPAFRDEGARILVEQLAEQVHPDGVYFEQSSYYQRYTIDFYLQLLILAEATGFVLPAEVSAAVLRMLDFMLTVRRPDGSLPPFGDADGGALIPLAERAAGDLRGTFSTAAAWFHRDDYAWAAGALAPETLWLLGEEGADAFSARSLAAPARHASRLFARGGYAVMASGFDAQAHQLIFDVGPLGCPVSSGHGHADLLSVQCSIFGEPVIVDPGTGDYADPIFRKHLRSTRAHSTVTVDDEEQAHPAGPFSWQERVRPSATLTHWLCGPDLDLADASHDAYRRLGDPVRHRRRALFVDPSGSGRGARCFVLIDDLEGAGTHRLDLRFQLAQLAVTREGAPGAEWVRAVTPGGHALLVRAFAPAPLALSISTGELHPPRGWLSPDYGQRVPAPLLVYSTEAALPLRIATVLYPLEDARGELPAVRALGTSDAAAEITGLLLGEETLHFGSAGVELAHLQRAR